MTLTLKRQAVKEPREKKPRTAEPQTGQASLATRKAFREGLVRKVAQILQGLSPLRVEEVADIARDLDAVECAKRVWTGLAHQDRGELGLTLTGDATGIDVCNPAGRLAFLSYLELLPALRAAAEDVEDEPLQPAKKRLVEMTDAELEASVATAKESHTEARGHRAETPAAVTGGGYVVGTFPRGAAITRAQFAEAADRPVILAGGGPEESLFGVRLHPGENAVELRNSLRKKLPQGRFVFQETISGV